MGIDLVDCRTVSERKVLGAALECPFLRRTCYQSWQMASLKTSVLD